jgi:tetratricopeptide (TPR) repeat protein
MPHLVVSATVMVLVCFLAGLVRAGDMTTGEPTSAGLAVGADVVLREPGILLRDGDHQLSSRGEVIFRIERLAAGLADIASTDGTVRGWIESDKLLPLGKAVDHFNHLIAANPKDPIGYLARGRVWIEKEEWDQALADLDSAAQVAPADPKSHHLRGLVLVQKKQLDEAIAAFTQAIKLDPVMAIAVRDRGLAWDAKRYFDKALDDLTEAIRLDPGNVDLVMTRAKVCSKRGRHNQAMADFAWVIRMRPVDPAGYVARAEELLENLESESAIADCTRALELDPVFIPALLVRAKAWKRRFDLARAVADIAEAVRRGPESQAAHRDLAWLLATCPQREFRDGPRGVQEGTAACELTQWNSAECLGALAAACAETGDFPAAVKWQTRAVELLPIDDKIRPLFRRRLFIYESKHPYRD